MEKEILINEEYLYIPVQKQSDTELVEIFLKSGKKLFEFNIPIGNIKNGHYHWDYFARLPVKKFIGQTLIIKGDVSGDFMELVNTNAPRSKKSPLRPLIHFTAESGWINDPNGLIFDKGLYHLYFQYNPFDVKWNNMSWGHAVSKDLINWTQLDAVMFPDENGLIFSGSAVKNENSLLGLPKDSIIYFYSAAGDGNKWSTFPYFTQRLAYSCDGGNTLTKIEKPCLGVIERDSRDPKVFWHEKSNAYIMVLWLKEREFGIFRSTDLSDFVMSDKFTIEDGWECPDLFMLNDDAGNEKWVFTCADGYYYFVSFDGYHISDMSPKHSFYFNENLYAAQTYSGIENKTILVPWMRVENQGDNYTGAMAIPRELKLTKANGKYVVVQKLIDELNRLWVETENITTDKTTYKIEINFCDSIDPKYELVVAGINISYNREDGILSYGEKSYSTIKNSTEIAIIVDYNLIEIFVGNNSISGAFILPDTNKSNEFCTSSNVNYKIYELKTNNFGR